MEPTIIVPMAGAAVGIWLGGYGLSQVNAFLTPYSEASVKIIMKNGELLRYVNGIKGKSITKNGLIVDGSHTAWEPAKFLWGATSLLSPVEKVLKWKEEYNKGFKAETDLSESLGIEGVNRVVDRLPWKRVEKFAICSVEITGAWTVDIYIQVELELINAYDPIFSVSPNGAYMEKIQGKLQAAIVDFVGPTSRGYEWLFREPHGYERSEFKNLMKGINMKGFGYKVIDAEWLGFEASKDPGSQAVVKAYQSVTINTETGKGEVALAKQRAEKAIHEALQIKRKGQAYEANPAALQKEIYEEIAKIQGTVVFGKKLPLSIPLKASEKLPIPTKPTVI